MSDPVRSRLYEEGNYGLKVFPLNSDGTYGTGVSIEGTVTVDITFSRTRTNTPADDIPDYLTRTSPEKGEGTVTIIGLSKAGYQALYNNIVDHNSVLVGGKRNQSKRLGVTFFNTRNDTVGTSENMFFLPNAVFELPNISTQTIQEDDTTIRPFELAITCNPQNFTAYGGGTDRYTWAMLNSVDDTSIYSTVKTAGTYVPDSVIGG